MTRISGLQEWHRWVYYHCFQIWLMSLCWMDDDDDGGGGGGDDDDDDDDNEKKLHVLNHKG